LPGEQGKGDRRRSALSCLLFRLDIEGILKPGPVRVQFGRQNLRFARAIEAQLADSDPLRRPDGRAKDPARHRPRRVQVARPSRRIQHGARLVVGEFGVCRMLFIELAGQSISGKAGPEPIDRFLRSLADSSRSRWIAFLKAYESASQPDGVQLSDRENSDAALRASRTALQPVARSPRSVGSGRVDNLHELPVARG